jgi:hypothetical protein
MVSLQQRAVWKVSCGASLGVQSVYALDANERAALIQCRREGSKAVT